MADMANLFGGQIPGLSPAIEAPLSTAQFLTGKILMIHLEVDWL